MNKVEATIRAQATESFKKRNPHMFTVVPAECYWSNQEMVDEEKRVKTNPGANARVSMGLSHDEFKLNKTERAYYEILKQASYLTWVGVQCMTFKLGDDCRYTPDFMAIRDNGELHAYEVKGFMRDDALVKLKVASRMYRFIRFFLVMKSKGQFSCDQVRA